MLFVRPLVFLTAFTAWLSPALRAEEAVPPKPAPSAPAGLVWRVSGGKSPLFLAGSFHLLTESDYPLPAAYEQAWNESRQVVFEIMPGETEKPEIRQKMADLSLLKEGKLSTKISAQTWKNLSDWAAGSGTSPVMLERFQPWMASLTVTVTTFEKLGYKSNLGMEKYFGDRLKKSGKSALGLETALGQVGIFANVSAARQEDMLRQSLEEVRQPEKIAKFVEAWRAGDADALHDRMHESFKDFPELEKLLLTDRNAAWIPVLEKILQGETATMVVVGAGHLCGPGSVVDLLDKKGYRAVPLIPAAAPPAAKKAA